MKLVEFKDLNYDDEIFGIPKDQEEQTFDQESAEGDNSEVSEDEMTELERAHDSRSQLQQWLDVLEQVTFGSQAGDVEAGNLLRQSLAELEQKALREEAEENQAADQGITEDINPEVEDLGDIQNDKDDNEIRAEAQAEKSRRRNRLKGKNRKEINNLFQRLLEEDSEDDKAEEEAKARLIGENNINGSDDDEDEPLQDFRGNAIYEDDNSSDNAEEFHDNQNSIWE
ncbi:hypothetical protein B0H16DRAFT_1717787 [Mycena metata]|uniref:Uncharacterized protein n=1 Tax=Mycena metata TaxID=1033252 RepID=A0AAD7NK69_9AGAR|nr:hypothetical protein B0H16DRAFT_1717787 [Mycena metata]